jgi:hypothetical protein
MSPPKDHQRHGHNREKHPKYGIVECVAKSGLLRCAACRLSPKQRLVFEACPGRDSDQVHWERNVTTILPFPVNIIETGKKVIWSLEVHLDDIHVINICVRHSVYGLQPIAVEHERDGLRLRDLHTAFVCTGKMADLSMLSSWLDLHSSEIGDYIPD